MFRFSEKGNIDAAIRKGFLEFDNEMSEDNEIREDLAGTTAVCVLIKENKLFCVSDRDDENELDCSFFREMSVIVVPSPLLMAMWKFSLSITNRITKKNANGSQLLAVG